MRPLSSASAPGKYLKEQSGIVIAGYTASQTRKSWESITSKAFVFPFLVFRWKKRVKVVITPQYSPSLSCYLAVEYSV